MELRGTPIILNNYLINIFRPYGFQNHSYFINFIKSPPAPVAFLKVTNNNKT